MKKLILTLITLVIVIAASAKFRYQSLDNFHGKTTVVLVDQNWKKGTQISNARFNDDGKTYEAKSMVISEQGNTLTLTMTFKKLTVFRKVSVTLNINNKDVTIPIELAEIASSRNNAYRNRQCYEEE